MSESNVISLSELNLRIKFALHDSFPDHYWIVAEISSIMENRSGHCYLELSDKIEGSDKINATAKATIWSSNYRLIKSYFESTTQQPLNKGLKIMVQVAVVFHELYGFSLNIVDIDPTYTLGDLAQKRLEIIQRLTNEGVIDMNKALVFPRLPKTIAVISSPTAAGYGDFMKQIEENGFGYQFHIQLFVAQMQGNQTSESIISALERIYEHIEIFDAVAIIRGGGSQGDLSYFDNYELAVNIAQFPLPIVTGIGHERDNSIADIVAYKCLKTPTAVAAFFVDCFHQEDLYLQSFQSDFSQLTQNMLFNHKNILQRMSQQFTISTHNILTTQQKAMVLIQEKISNIFHKSIDSQKIVLSNKYQHLLILSKYILEQEKIRLEMTAQNVQLVNPTNILKRGYSISRINGQFISHMKNIPQNATLETILSDCRIFSQIESIESSKNQST